MFAAALRRCGLIAILRGVHPREVVDMGTELYSAGSPIIEVPLSSPRPFESIRALRSYLAYRMLCATGESLLSCLYCKRYPNAGISHGSTRVPR